MTGSKLELVKVTKRYGAATAVDAIDLRVPAGAYCCLLGPSGCGKTIDAAHDRRPRERDRGRHHPRRRRTSPTCRRPARGTAMMFQSYALFPHLTALDNVAFSPEDAGRRQGRAPRHARMELLELVAMERLCRAAAGAALGRPAAARGAGPRADHRAADAAARRAALGARPVPAHQDARRAEALQKELGITFIHVTHAQDEAMALADLVVVMNRAASSRRARRARCSTRRARRSSRASSAATTSSRATAGQIAVRADQLQARAAAARRSACRAGHAWSRRRIPGHATCRSASRADAGDATCGPAAPRREFDARRRVARRRASPLELDASATSTRSLAVTRTRFTNTGGAHDEHDTKQQPVSRRVAASRRARRCGGRRRRGASPASRPSRAGEEGAALPRHRGEPVTDDRQEVQGRHRHHASSTSRSRPTT